MTKKAQILFSGGEREERAPGFAHVSRLRRTSGSFAASGLLFAQRGC